MPIAYHLDRYTTKLTAYLKRCNATAKKKINLATIEKAIYYAQTYHAGQARQSGEPFYSHPLAVAGRVAEYCFKTDDW